MIRIDKTYGMYQLRHFAAVISTGSFSRAARECHVAQPSLSQQIMKLEEKAGEGSSVTTDCRAGTQENRKRTQKARNEWIVAEWVER
jgi:hypothetical protein